MTLAELSPCYQQAALLLRTRLRELRHALATETDPDAMWHLQQRIRQLQPMLVEMNELAELTAHYYERGYYRNGRYTL